MASERAEIFLTSRLLPFRHGFSTRAGGVSEGPFAALNLGFSVGDVRERVEENLRRLAHAAGIRAGDFVTASQVHSDCVVKANEPAAGDLPSAPQAEADALWTDRAGVAVSVKTADCVPILIGDPDTGRVAAVHSGWRGTELRIAARAVEALAAAGSKHVRLIAAIGPAIQECCYEVSEDLGERFARALGEEVVARGFPKPHLNLPRAILKTLEQAGVPPERIDVLTCCTACDAERFFSHRRDRGVSGRHLSFVVGGAPLSIS